MSDTEAEAAARRAADRVAELQELDQRLRSGGHITPEDVASARVHAADSAHRAEAAATRAAERMSKTADIEETAADMLDEHNPAAAQRHRELAAKDRLDAQRHRDEAGLDHEIWEERTHRD